jgi:hypothetical protein
VSSETTSSPNKPKRKQKELVHAGVYLLDEEYLVTAFVPSETACFASSPGRISLTDVWISRDEMVDFLLYAASFEASVATRSKISDGQLDRTRERKHHEVERHTIDERVQNGHGAV